jgi:hypothetical protein
MTQWLERWGGQRAHAQARWARHPRVHSGTSGPIRKAAATGPDLPLARIRCPSASLPLSVEVNADAPEQRIDAALQLADHWPDPPSLNQPLPRTRFPSQTPPALRISSSYSPGHRTITQPTPSVPNMTGPMLGGTSTST